MTTTPLAFARCECANYFGDDGREHGDYRPCLVKAGKRCRYFETCVLPLAKARPDRFAAAAAAYWKRAAQAEDVSAAAIPDAQAPTRPCPDCGTPLRPRRRYCDDCAPKRQRIAERAAREAKRAARTQELMAKSIL